MNEAKAKEIVTELRSLRDSYTRLEKLLNGGPAEYYFDKIEEVITGLFSRAAFQIGDRVVLLRDINCDDKPGWANSEHFLKAGATARVDDISFRKNDFTYGVIFDNETWLDESKTPRPVTGKHQYWFFQSALTRIG